MASKILVSSTTRQWLAGETAQWVQAGFIDAEQAQKINHRYATNTMALSVNHLLNSIGAALIGAAIVWFVAANIENFTPWGRVGLLAGLWVGFLALAQWLNRYDRPIWTTLAHVLSVIAYSATVYQSCQTANYNTETPYIFGICALGSFSYAYLVRSTFTTALATVAVIIWLIWHVNDLVDTGIPGAITGVCLASLLATAAIWHRELRPNLAAICRIMGEATGLIAVICFACFVNPILGSSLTDVTLNATHWAALIVPIVIAGAAAFLIGKRAHNRWARAEQLVPVGLSVVLIGVYAASILITKHYGFSYDMVGSARDFMAYLIIGMLLLAIGILVCVWYAILGSAHDTPLISHLAVAALVVLAAIQSSSYFMELLDGAWVVLVVGLILIGIGAAIARGHGELKRFAGKAITPNNQEAADDA